MSAKQLTTLAVVTLIASAATWIWFELSSSTGDANTNANSNDRQLENVGHSIVQLAGDPTAINPKVDPSNDVWPTEVTHDAVKKQLSKLQKALHSGNTEKLQDFTTDSFSAKSFDTTHLVKAFDDGTVTIYRVSPNEVPAIKYATLNTFVTALTSSVLTVERSAFKVVGISANGKLATTSVLVEMRSRSADGIDQINATWDCTWRVADTPKLASVSVRDFERVHVARGSSLYSDLTASVLGNTPDYAGHVLRGIDYWSQRLTGIDDMHIYGHHGVSIADVNGDGLEDIYVCDAGGLPNRLYLQDKDGTAIDFSSRSKADWLESTSSALLIDIDNDDDQDLVAATIAGIIFAANDGSGVFQIRNAFTGLPEANSMCAADFDNDGDLDIYICNYGPARERGGERGYEGSVPIPYNDANNGGANVLLRNDGGFRFKDVAKSVGLDENNRRFSFAAAWEDFDQDGDPDLYVANDFGRNNLYENRGGHFRDIAATAGVEDMAGGMSVSWGDFNRDGRMDIYIGNMFSAAGNRVTYQRQFTDRHSTRSAGMQRMARGNTLFASNADGSFTDVSETAGVTMGRWAWSSCFADFNNDGWQDLAVANGYFTSTDTDDL